MIRFIGDIHANFKRYMDIVNDFDGDTIQVGDFGVGFAPVPELELRHRFIRGNHDNPVLCRDQNMPWSLNYIPDGMWNTNDMFFVGGALSIDQHLRTDGLNWWRDEELSYGEFTKILADYSDLKPDVMVTHDCPESIAKQLFDGQGKIFLPSITRNALQAALEIHEPKLWIFGHWHQSVDVTINNTRFICLNELEYKDIEI